MAGILNKDRDFWRKINEEDNIEDRIIIGVDLNTRIGRLGKFIGISEDGSEERRERVKTAKSEMEEEI